MDFRWQPKEVNFEPILRGHTNEIFDWDQVYNSFHACKNQLHKKNRVNIIQNLKWMDKVPLEEGPGGRRLMAKVMTNFHICL